MISQARSADQPIAMVMDLCLFRVVNESCGGRVLPFGVRQLIKEYAFLSFDNETLREVVQLWCRDRTTARQQFGEINDWDVSKVTNMAKLFQYTQFNDLIDRWDVGRVTSMVNMFHIATQFNQPLNTWNVRCVQTMAYMFRGAVAFNQPLDRWDVRLYAVRCRYKELVSWLCEKLACWLANVLNCINALARNYNR